MKRRKLTLLLFALFALLQHAAAFDGLWLEKKDGTRLGFKFADEITITYRNDSVIISSLNASAAYPFEEVKKITFAEGVNEIKDTKADVNTSKVLVYGDRVELVGFAAGMPVGVYDLSGRRVLEARVQGGKVTTVSLLSLPQGPYIVKVEKTSVKLIRK